jgi:electron-transferring-flavoprotein dehydrogenase
MTEIMECDVLVVGAGPAGLSAAIRLKQLSPDTNVILLEKGSEVGAHILSGAVFDPIALNELIPDWQDKGAPLNTAVGSDAFHLLTKAGKFRLPTPPQMHNHGNYIISLGNLCRWLAGQAEGLGVQIFPGFPAAEAIIENEVVKGVRTGAFGISKHGEKKSTYQEPMELRAKVTLFAEGCRGSLSQQLMETFKLRENAKPQTYGIGIKEIWQVDPAKHQLGRVEHSIGWPMSSMTYGGSFIYHMEDNQIAVGFVVGLDYANPHLDPFKEFQRFKTHPKIRPLFEGGKRLTYGARAINEGGWQSIPKLTFAGGALIGCAAGFLNVPRIKGSHTAMKSGMLAAEAVVASFTSNIDLATYDLALKNSWVGQELYRVRNIRPSFKLGMWAGLVLAAIDTYLFKGNAPWTFIHQPDHKALRPAAKCKKIDYPVPDGVVSFDRLSSVYLSNTNHEEDQPAHLKLKDANVPAQVNLALYDGPEARFCPAGVYEFVEEGGLTSPSQPSAATPAASGSPSATQNIAESGKCYRLQINAQNCVHCKTCDIKDPTQNIVWTTPEGGGGPNYPNM